MEIYIGIVLLIIFICMGVSIPCAFGAILLFYVVTLGGSPATTVAVGFSSMNSLVLLSIPMFILAGMIIEKGKIGDSLVDIINLFFGRIKGALGAVTVIASGVFGSISGSAAATVSCIGSIMYPKLRDSNYDRGFATAIIVNAGPLGLLIPPSATQILYAWSGGVSVLACFLSTVIPGIILISLLSVINFVYAKKNKNIVVSKDAVKPFSTEGGKRTLRATPALIFPIIVLGGIYGGAMTPTEAAVVAALYSIPVGMFYYKGIKAKDLPGVFVKAGETTGVVMVMLFVIMIVSRYFVMEDLPSQMGDLLFSISDNPITILFMCNIFMIIIGMLMDDTSGTLLCTPLLLPIMMSIDVSPIQFAAILGVNLGMGNITPPTAPLLYMGCRMTGAPVNEVIKPTLLMILFAWLPTLLLTTYVPQISLFLPSLFGLV